MVDIKIISKSFFSFKTIFLLCVLVVGGTLFAGQAMAAATLTLSGGVATYVGSDGVDNSLTVSLSGTTYTFADTGETITLSGFTGGTGTGTNTITFSTTNNTVNSFAVNPGTGTNTTNINSSGLPLTFTATGTDTFKSPTSGSSSNITGNLTLTTTAGTLTATVSGGSYSSGQSIAIGTNSVTGFLGASGAYTINFSAAGGTFTQLRLLDSSSSANLTAVVANPAVKIVTDLIAGLGSSKTWNIKSVGVASSSFNSGSGNDTYVVGTAAGSTAGCDAIPAITLVAAAGTNSIQVDDSGSASGNKTIGVNNTTITGLGTGTFTYGALGGNLNNGLTLLGSSIGGNTWNIAALASTSQLSITGGVGGDNFNLNGSVSKAALTAVGGANSFNFLVDAKTIASPGTVTGSTGADTLSYAGRTTAVTVNVTSDGVDGAGGTATGMVSFSKINNFVGPTSGGGTLDVSGVSGTTDNGSGTLTFLSSRTATYNGFIITGATSSNHAPTFTSISNTAGYIKATNIVTFTSVANDSDVSDTIQLFVCKANDFTGSACGAGGAYCSSSAGASNPTCSYTVSGSDVDSSHAYYANLIDNNSAQASTNPISHTFLTDIAAPTVDAGLDSSHSAIFTQDATASDATSGIATYAWTQLSGTGTITFGTPTTEDTTVSANINDTYIIRLTVTDNAGNSTSDTASLIWIGSTPASTPTPTSGGNGALQLLNILQNQSNPPAFILPPDCQVPNLFSTTTGLPCATQPQAPSPPSTHYIFPRYLGYTDTGEDVLKLQQLLQALRFFLATVKPTGYYGLITKASVQRFQQAQGIRQTGNVGPSTLKSLNSL